MLNTKLETFIKVTDTGSFNKAAEELLISAPAVIKQINTLEDEIGFELFIRTNRGLTLTESGQLFYNDVKYLLQYYEGSLARAKQSVSKSKNLLRVGTSTMTPGQFLVDLWPNLHTRLPGMKFQLIPFHNTPENAKEIEKNFGHEIDLIVGVYDDDFLKERFCDATWLSDEPVRIGISSHHPLYEKDELDIEDLYGETLMLIHRGWNSHMDALRDVLETDHPQIRLLTFGFYSVEAYNQCESENNLIVTIDRWKDVHPLMKTLPIQWEHRIPFGILHSRQPSSAVRRFLAVVNEAVH